MLWEKNTHKQIHFMGKHTHTNSFCGKNTHKQTTTKVRKLVVAVIIRGKGGGG